jgi:dolichol-phosphate mannosyltransferase
VADKEKVCVILPTFNEVENVSIIIPLIFEQSTRIQTHDLHVLVVDANSPDGTQDAVRILTKELPNLHLITGEKRGLGEAYKRGLDHALNKLDARLIVQMDADLQHDPRLLPQFTDLSHRGFGVVIGSRLMPGGSTPGFSLHRKALSLLGNSLIRFVAGLSHIHDCTSGYRCITAEIIRKCDLSNLSTSGFAFQSSFIFELVRAGAKVIEVPITMPDRIHGESKLGFRDQVEFLLNLAKILVWKRQKRIS